MSTCTLRNDTQIGDYKKPYIVAEVNTSHNGNIDTAKKMIESAKDAGCNCVKFQSWSAETLYSSSYYKQNPILKRMFTKFSFSETELLEVANYSKQIGIAFASTPYSKREVDFLLEKCDVPYIKVASMDINNYPFIDYIARKGAPIVLATGMAGMDEICKAVEVIVKTGNKNLCLLHCISIYPPDISTIRLLNIAGLKEAFPEIPIGFSDHSLGIEMASAAVALGAAMIEKHLTLDRLKIGMDNQMAIEPGEMKQMVQNCHNVNAALGGKERIVIEAELLQRKKMRRSVIVNKDLRKGDVLTVEDLDSKRPGTGFPPEKISELAGIILCKDVEADTILEADAIILEHKDIKI